MSRHFMIAAAAGALMTVSPAMGWSAETPAPTAGTPASGASQTPPSFVPTQFVAGKVQPTPFTLTPAAPAKVSPPHPAPAKTATVATAQTPAPAAPQTAAPQAAAATESTPTAPAPAAAPRAASNQAWITPSTSKAVEPSKAAEPSKDAAAATEPPALDPLSPRATEVAEIAARNGDRDFLMIDKAAGKIFVFENNRPVLSGPVLTGASPADKFPAGILTKPSSYKFKESEKVTPAGRFTLSRTEDPELGGTVFEINEVHGPDWWLAIHSVYLGIPTEHRMDRIKSGDPEQQRITFGCMNVKTDFMRYLVQHLPKKGNAVLYVLPRDEAATPTYFTPRNASATPGTPRT